MVQQRDADLPQMVTAGYPSGGFSGRLNRRKQQRDQPPDNHGDHEQFDERKRTARSGGF